MDGHMQLDSYLEIFTTLYGWAFANIFTSIVTGTGLAALPFALIVFNAWREIKEKGMTEIGITGLLEMVQTRLITATVVMSLCFLSTPLISLDKISLTYVPKEHWAEPNRSLAPVSQLTGTKTTYDTAMSSVLNGNLSSQELKQVPIWWYAVMSVSSGFSRAFRSMLETAGSEIRILEEMARSSSIEDPKLLSSIQNFYSQCFTPARSKYLRMEKQELSPAGQALVHADNTEYGPEDVNWMGSKLFRTEPGFYGDMRSYHPVPGWKIDFARDVDYIQTPATTGPEAGYVNPPWGRPTCKEWWEDESIGLRHSMISHSSTWRALATKAKSVFNSEDKTKDAVAKLAQTQADPQYVSPDIFFGPQHDSGTVVARAVGGVVSAVGTGIASMVTNITVAPLQNGLLMFQAMALMFLYTMLPLTVFLSGYDLKTMFLGALAIFTVKFWGCLWFIVNWIDGRMMESMYPPGSFDVDFLVQTLQNGNKRMLLNILVMGGYVWAPILWTGLMAMIGYRSIDVLNGIGDVSGAAKSSVPRKLR